MNKQINKLPFVLFRMVVLFVVDGNRLLVCGTCLTFSNEVHLLIINVFMNVQEQIVSFLNLVHEDLVMFCESFIFSPLGFRSTLNCIKTCTCRPLSVFILLCFY